MITSSDSQSNIFKSIVECLNKKQPLQKNKIGLYLEDQPKEFFEKADKYLNALFTVAKNKFNYSLEEFINSYIDFCKMIVMEGLYFKKHGTYRSSNQQNNLSYYENETYMFSYMCGLGISQFLWPNHQKMWNFFQNVCNRLALNIKNYLEVGPGHGFYLCEAMQVLNEAEIKCIDLSKSSLEITSQMCNLIVSNKCNLEVINGNFLEISSVKKNFDLIVICEVLEHLNNPNTFLKHTHNLLSENGSAIISTCANSACVDHIYLYKSIEHIKSDLKQEGFFIEEELALPVNEKDNIEGWFSNQVESNYIALIKKSG